MMRIVPNEDGTYTLYRGNTPLVKGLTRDQADQLVAAMRVRPV